MVLSHIEKLPQEIKYEIYEYLYHDCELCFRKVLFSDLYRIKDIYKIKLCNNSFEFIYLFRKNNQKICYFCFATIKYWFD